MTFTEVEFDAASAAVDPAMGGCCGKSPTSGIVDNDRIPYTLSKEVIRRKHLKKRSKTKHSGLSNGFKDNLHCHGDNFKSGAIVAVNSGNNGVESKDDVISCLLTCNAIATEAITSTCPCETIQSLNQENGGLLRDVSSQSVQDSGRHEADHNGVLVNHVSEGEKSTICYSTADTDSIQHDNDLSAIPDLRDVSHAIKHGTNTDSALANEARSDSLTVGHASVQDSKVQSSKLIEVLKYKKFEWYYSTVAPHQKNSYSRSFHFESQNLPFAQDRQSGRVPEESDVDLDEGTNFNRRSRPIDPITTDCVDCDSGSNRVNNAVICNTLTSGADQDLDSEESFLRSQDNFIPKQMVPGSALETNLVRLRERSRKVRSILKTNRYSLPGEVLINALKTDTSFWLPNDEFDHQKNTVEDIESTSDNPFQKLLQIDKEISKQLSGDSTTKNNRDLLNTEHERKNEERAGLNDRLTTYESGEKLVEDYSSKERWRPPSNRISSATSLPMLPPPSPRTIIENVRSKASLYRELSKQLKADSEGGLANNLRQRPYSVMDIDID